MKIIEKSLKLANNLFSDSYRSGKYKCYHFAFGFERNKLLAIGQNGPNEPNAKAIKFASKFGFEEEYRRQNLHAELSMISKLWGRHYIDASLRLVVLRLNSRGELKNSKPCSNCQIVLDALCVSKVWYSDEYGEIVKL